VTSNGDGSCDTNCDTTGDGVADTNIDNDGDGNCDLNCDTTGDGMADTNIDNDGDGNCDLNCDTNNDGSCDTNCDTTGDGMADTNIDNDGDGNCDLNCDTNNDGSCDTNCDTTGDGMADTNIDNDGDGNCDLNCDTTGDGNCDLNCDTNGDGLCDTNCDCGVEYRVDYDVANQEYVVYMRSFATLTGIDALTGGAQVTLIAPTGNVTIDTTTLTDVTGDWYQSTTIVAPTENPTKDYLVFNLSNAISNATAFTYTANTEIELFRFENLGICVDSLNLFESNDPFAPNPPSQPINVGNQWTANGCGNINAWISNYGNATIVLPNIDTEPVDTSVCEGNDASFTVVASGDNLTYQLW